jgi:maleate isomerase
MYRVGLLIPASNTVMEPDMVAGLGNRATLHSARMWLDEPVSRDAEIRMLDEEVAPSARMLSPIEPDIAVFGCTSAGSIRGMDGDAALREQLRELVNCAVIGVMDSIGWWLGRISVSEVSLLAPYPKAVTDVVAAGLDEMGLRVVNQVSMGVANNRDVGRIPPAAVVGAAGGARSSTAGALVVACTNLRSYEVRQAISEAARLPTVTAVSAVVDRTQWQMRDGT